MQTINGGRTTSALDEGAVSLLATPSDARGCRALEIASEEGSPVKRLSAWPEAPTYAEEFELSVGGASPPIAEEGRQCRSEAQGIPEGSASSEAWPRLGCAPSGHLASRKGVPVTATPRVGSQGDKLKFAGLFKSQDVDPPATDSGTKKRGRGRKHKTVLLSIRPQFCL